MIYQTSDGVQIIPGLRVVGHRPQWGTIDPGQFNLSGPRNPDSPDFDGWFDVILDSGDLALYKNTRMFTTGHEDDPNPHNEYPHQPGFLYDCPQCEARCHCTPRTAQCVFNGPHLSPARPVLPCVYCDRTFSTLEDLNEHTSSTHDMPSGAEQRTTKIKIELLGNAPDLPVVEVVEVEPHRCGRLCDSVIFCEGCQTDGDKVDILFFTDKGDVDYFICRSCLDNNPYMRVVEE